MSDRELLELAAKAAGFSHYRYCDVHMALVPEAEGEDVLPFSVWNPLTDDGDALRLAVKLQLGIELQQGFKQVCCRRSSDRDNFEMHGLVGYGEGTAPEPTAKNVRRAIVSAAANIGRKMK